MPNAASSPWRPAHEEWLRAHDPGVTSRALYEAFTDQFGLIRNYEAFKDFVLRIRAGAHVTTATAALPGDPLDLEAVSREEQQKIRRQFEHNLLGQLKREKAMTDAVVDALERLTPKVPRAKVAVLPAPKSDSKPQTAVLLLSDLHVGAVADKEETGGFGEYNYPIFRRRLKHLQDAIRSITAHHRKSHPVPHLVAALLGDLIENVEIFGAQAELVDLDLMAQVLAVIEDVAEFLLGLLDTFEHIYVPCVTGNHGRLGRKGQHKRHINWDYLVGKVLAMKLEAFSDRITVEVPKAPFMVIDIEGYRWLLRHGDGIKSWGGIPYYGIQRSTGRWIAIQSSIGQHFDYMAMGHFHSPAHLPFTGGETIINGCFPGTTEFSVEVIESLTKPMQFFGMVHPDFGLGARYPILLDRPKSRAA